MRLADAGASVTAVTTTYLGTAGTDSIKSLAVSGGAVYVAGTTNGALPGETKSGLAGTTNGFAAKLEASGDVDWLYQYGGASGISAAASITVDPAGASVLDTLGLRRGTLDYTRSPFITANSSLRAGDSFSISFGDRLARTIRIAAGDTIHALTTKINTVLLAAGKASKVLTTDGYKLKIAANPGVTITLKAGPQGSDALKALALAPGLIFGDTSSTDSSTQSTGSPTASTNIIGLELDAVLNIASKDEAKKAKKGLDNALLQVKAAYRKLTLDPLLAKLRSASSAAAAPVPAYLQLQFANYQSALAQMQWGTSVLL